MLSLPCTAYDRILLCLFLVFLTLFWAFLSFQIRPKENGKTKQSKSCIWVYRTDIHEWPPIVLYKCQPERKVEKFLDGFHGYLHTDASDVTCCGYCPICAESLWRPYLATSSNPEGLLTPAQIGRDCCDQLIYM